MSSIRSTSAVTVGPFWGFGTALRAQLHHVGLAATRAFPLVPAGARPQGHVIGHTVGELLPPSLEGYPRGHVVGRPAGLAPRNHHA